MKQYTFIRTGGDKKHIEAMSLNDQPDEGQMDVEETKTNSLKKSKVTFQENKKRKMRKLKLQYHIRPKDENHNVAK